MNLVNGISAVIPHSAAIADTYCDAFEYDKAFFVPKSLAVEFLRSDCTLAVFHAYQNNCFLVDSVDFIHSDNQEPIGSVKSAYDADESHTIQAPSLESCI